MTKMRMYLIIFVLFFLGNINNVSYAAPGDGVQSPVKNLKRKNSAFAEEYFSRIKYRYDHAIIEKHLRAYLASNLSIVKYTKENKIRITTFRYWINKYKDGGYTFKIDELDIPNNALNKEMDSEPPCFLFEDLFFDGCMSDEQFMHLLDNYYK